MAEMSPLRRRMLEDMAIRNLSPATQQSYLYAVATFSRHFGLFAGSARHRGGSRLPGAPGGQGTLLIEWCLLARGADPPC